LKHAFLDKYAGLESPVHQLDARAKILSFFALIVICVSTPPEAWGAFAGYFAFLAVVAVASSVPAGYILRRSLVIVPFVAMVAPFLLFLRHDGIAGGWSLGIGPVSVSRSGLMVFWNVLVKACVAILAVILLSSTTPFPSLMRGLEQLRVPRVFVMLASFAYRYIFILVDEAERMERARDSRGYRGRWLWQAKVIGQMIGTLFLRSYERAERVYAAMVSRGFTGEAVAGRSTRMTATDWLFLAGAAGLFLLLRAAT